MKSDFKEGRLGYGFKGGKFYRFDKRHVVVLNAWPDLRVWCKMRSRPWHASRRLADAEFTSITPIGDPCERALIADCGPDTDRIQKAVDIRLAAIGGYLATFPPEVLDEVRRYSDRRWHLACLFARCPAALSLSQSNPPLAYALASNWVFHKPAPRRPMRAARAWTKKDAHVLAQWLGFPHSAAAVHVLGGIVPKSLSILGLLYLRKALRCPDVVSMLSRLERINADVFALFTAPEIRPYLSWRLIKEASMRAESDEPDRRLLFEIKDTLAMAKESGHLWKIGRFESVAQVGRLHSELLEEHR